MAASADSKRMSLGGRVATPRVGSPASSMSLETALGRSIGARIRVQTSGSPSKKIEGYIFSVSPSSPFLTLTPLPIVPSANGTPSNTQPQQPPPTSYTVVPISTVQSFTLLELGPSSASNAPGSGASTPTSPHARSVPVSLPPLPPIDHTAVQNRLNNAVRKLQEEDSKKGRGVTTEAQVLFDSLSKTLPCAWDKDRIVVNESVIVEPPYGPQNCKAGVGVSASALPRIRKVVEAEKKKIEATRAKGQKPGLAEKKGG